MARYGRKAATKVAAALHRQKRGKLKSGGSGDTVKSRKQAIAIGLSEARRAGGKVPRQPQKDTTKKAVKTRPGARRPGKPSVGPHARRVSSQARVRPLLSLAQPTAEQLPMDEFDFTDGLKIVLVSIFMLGSVQLHAVIDESGNHAAGRVDRLASPATPAAQATQEVSMPADVGHAADNRPLRT